MSADDPLPEQNRILAEALSEVEGQVKREIVEIFRDLLVRMWERLAAFIGDTATAAIFASAKREVARDYPFLEMVDVNPTGVKLDRLTDHLPSVERVTIRTGLLAFMDSVIGLIADLTGEVLLRKVQPLVHELREQLKEE